jgi:hypothetical protein
LKAIVDREATIKKLEGELRQTSVKSAAPKLPDVPSWVEKQLRELTAVLKTDAARTKSSSAASTSNAPSIPPRLSLVPTTPSRASAT